MAIQLSFYSLSFYLEGAVLGISFFWGGVNGYKCTAAADILKNISFKLIGRITTDGATSLVEALKYPDLVYENSTKAFKTDKEKGCSHWLLEIQNQFWQTQFYPSPSNLAMVANGSNEVKIRTQIMDEAIANRTSRWEALEQYAKAIMASP